MPQVSIASAAFPQCFLRLDGSGVTTSTDNGSGTVNCQSGVGPYETLVLDTPAGQFMVSTATAAALSTANTLLVHTNIFALKLKPMGLELLLLSTSQALI
jgi:hypothetical protein